MHLIFFLRGIEHRVELWKHLAEGQFFRWKRVNLKTNQEEYVLVQGSLRPSFFGAWEYVFPEEALSDVLSILGLNDGNIGLNPNGFNGFVSKSKLKMIRLLFGAERITKKMLQDAMKIPSSLILTDSQRGLSHLLLEGVSIHPIGIKRDIRQRREDFGYEQEML